MLMIADLLCDRCGFEEYDVCYERHDGAPECHCGHARHVFWPMGSTTPAIHGDGPGSFAVRETAEGRKIETRDEWNQLLAEAQARFPGKQINVVPDSAEARQKRADEARHRAYERQRARGVTASDIAMNAEARKRISAEAARKAESRNQNPSVAAKKASESVPSATQVATGGREAKPLLSGKATVIRGG